jgi:hypothetical protein
MVIGNASLGMAIQPQEPHHAETQKLSLIWQSAMWAVSVCFGPTGTTGATAPSISMVKDIASHALFARALMAPLPVMQGTWRILVEFLPVLILVTCAGHPTRKT